MVSIGILLQVVPGGGGRIHAVIEDPGHDLVLHRQGEFEVLQELADIRAFRDIARPGQGTDLGAAEIGTEDVVAAGQVGELEPTFPKWPAA